MDDSGEQRTGDVQVSREQALILKASEFLLSSSSSSTTASSSSRYVPLAVFHVQVQLSLAQDHRRRRFPVMQSSPTHVWPPPRSPLPPHRLAKLANALGVSTPLPAVNLSPSPLPLLGNSSNTDLSWRSVTPSTASTLNLVSPVHSKFLLHVIPPFHLPHDDTSDSTDLAPPPSTASGYHTQFRRGTLVALQSTLQAQLLVIAREYALPSTIGVVLYLVTATSHSRHDSPQSSSSSPPCEGAGGADPGPRLSEEIWKHIWTRVLRAERDELVALSRSVTPNPLGLGLTVDLNTPSQSLRPLLTPTRTEHPRPLVCPITPSTSTSTASSVSDVRSHDKSTGVSSRSEPNTPDTSRSSDHGHSDIDLPGLNSPSIIPILAKVEFDIDRRKATWYEPWLRSRRMKRTDCHSSHSSDSRSRTLESTSPVDEKRAPYDLKLVQRMQKPPFLRSQDDSDDEEQLSTGEYAPLSESPDADATARMTSTVEQDPLEDVFGNDADAWTDIHAESDGARRKVDDPNVVELALDAASLTALPEQEQEQSVGEDDVSDVRDIIRRMSRPPLTVSIPNPTETKRRSSPSTAVGKRPMPPPLVLVPKSPTISLVEGVTDSSDFRNKEGSSPELEQEFQRSRNHGEEKRVGTVFDDLDLGLDLGDDDQEYDENDPNDRRRSQYLMKAKLDEIERALAQFSPRQLKTTISDEDPTMVHHRSLSTASQPHTPPLAEPLASPLPNAWPSIPYASVTRTISGSPTRHADQPPSPPRLALNGISTGAPRAFMPSSSPSPILPTESQLRRRELEQAMYPATRPSPSRQMHVASDSPIPLSPDPFGRHPSVYEVDAAPMQSYWDPSTQKLSHEPLDPIQPIDDGSGSLDSTPPSSRFSVDSSSVVDHGDKFIKPIAPLVSVKGLKNLWRKSKSSSSTLPQTPTPGQTSFQLPNSQYPPTPTDQLVAPPLLTATTRGSNGKVHVGQLQFDQEPYPPSRLSLVGSQPISPAILLNTPAQEKPGIRKSILKSWKTVANGSQSVNGSEPRKSSERVFHETIKTRRPSVLDGSIPPSPQLPPQYLSSNHVRTGSNFLERPKSAARTKAGHHHPSASHDLLSTVPPAHSPINVQMPESAPSSRLQFLARSRDSRVECLEMFSSDVVPLQKSTPV